MMRIHRGCIVVFVFIAGMVSGCNSSGVAPSATAIQVEPTIAPTVTAILPTFTMPPTEMPPLPTDTSEPQIIHQLIPGSPLGKMMQTVHDQVDEYSAEQKQAFGGDDFKNGKYERPFDPEMNYIPLADLVTVYLSREDPLWIYVLFKVNNEFSSEPEAIIDYLVEIDTDLDSRGDLLILTGIPKSDEWSTESVRVITAPDRNIGGVDVVRPDEFLSEGRGYYSEIFSNGSGDDADLAWSRLSKDDADVVILAFKNTLVGGEKGKFIWLPWSDAGMHDVTLFEFNDHFTFAQAGYPLKEDPDNYPLKALWGVDNTCRIPASFTPTGYMPGLCQNYDPVPGKSDSKVCPPCRKPPCPC